MVSTGNVAIRINTVLVKVDLVERLLRVFNIRVHVLLPNLANPPAIAPEIKWLSLTWVHHQLLEPKRDGHGGEIFKAVGPKPL